MLPKDLLLEPAWQRVAVVLLHFVWQGALIAAVYGVVVEWLMRRPQQRYAAGVIALAVMIVGVPITYCVVEPPATLIGLAIVQEIASPPSVVEISPSFADVDQAHPLMPATIALSTATGRTIPVESTTDREADLGPSWREELYRKIVVVWLVGVAAFSLRLLSGAIGLRWLTGRTSAVSGELTELVARLGRRMSFRRLPRLVISQRVTEAIAAGFFRPVIVLPAAWLAELPPSVIEAVLAHELAHIRRYDLWVNLLQRTVEAVLFFHPAVWWVSRQVRSDREMCCDELAVTATGQKVAYVSALEVVARRAAREPLFSLATGIGGRKMQLLDRVRHVLGLPSRQRPGGWWAAGVLALAVPCGLWALTGPAAPRAFAQDEPGEREREERVEREERDREEREERDERDESEREEGQDQAERDRDRGEDSPEARAAREERQERRLAQRRREREVRERGDRNREERDVEVELEFRRDRPELVLERRAQAEDQRRRAEQRAQHARARQQNIRAEVERAHAQVQRRLAEAQRQMSEEMRKAGERGEGEKVEAMRRELEAMRANAEREVRTLEEQMRNVQEDVERQVLRARREELRERPERAGGMDAQREMMQMIRELRNEVQQLRHEVRELREREAGKDRPRVELRKESAKVPILGDVPYVGKLFRNEVVKEIEIEFTNDELEKLDDVEIEFTRDPEKLDGVKLDSSKDPVKIDGGKLKITKEPVKLDGVKLELKKEPIEKLKGVTVELKKDPIKLDGITIEFKKDAIQKIQGATIDFKKDAVEKIKRAEIEFKKAPVGKLKDLNIELKKDPGDKVKELKIDLQGLKERAANDVDVRYAEKAAEVAKKELEMAIKANRTTPGAVSDLEVVHKKLTLERGILEIERAKREQSDRLRKLQHALDKQADEKSTP